VRLTRLSPMPPSRRCKDQPAYCNIFGTHTIFTRNSNLLLARRDPD
jgi:hypothetical protein